MPVVAWLRHLTWRSLLHWISLMLIPVVFIVVGIHLKDSRGPYWLGSNYDPDYPYLMNALNIIEHLPIGLIGHPGTPVQVFSAWLVQGTHLLRNNFHYDVQTLETDVLIHPEFYLQIISYAFLIINAGLLLVIGITTYRRLQNIWLAFLLQAAPFFSSYVPMNSLVKVAPEALLLTVALALLWLLVVMLGGSTTWSWRRALWSTSAFSLLLGLGIATKMNFLPMTLLPLIAIRTIRLKALYLLGTVGWFFLFTWPIRTRYAELFSWLTSIFQHTGIHGAGSAKIIDWPVYWANLQTLISGFPYIFQLCLLFLLLAIVGIVVLPQRRQYLQATALRLGLAATLTQLAGFAFIAKHMMQYYYLPFVPLTAIIVCCALVLLRDWHQPKTAGTICVGLVFIGIALHTLVSTYRDIKVLNAIEKKTKEEVLVLRQTLAEDYPEYTVFHYFRSSSPEFALKFGNDFVSDSYDWELTQIYPGYYFYEISTNQFKKWNTVIDINAWLQRQHKTILTGSPFETTYQHEPQYRPNLPLTNQFNGTSETFYTVSQ